MQILLMFKTTLIMLTICITETACLRNTILMTELEGKPS